ncbi:MAG: CHAP domain-containing protein, partial [Candidatus Dormibacteraeota bacterium]|nr:CHAP domain-containing protein [Candidatus Dormibacteraeota bacterium]
MKLLIAALGAVFGLSLAPVLVPQDTSSSTGPAAQVSGQIEPAAARPLFTDVPAMGYPDRFPFGQCTWWAAFNVSVTWWGNAGDWVAGARAAGRLVSPVPVVHSIVVYVPSAAYSPWGHVGVVVAVESQGFEVSEMNYADGGRGTGVIDLRLSPWPDGLVDGFI